MNKLRPDMADPKQQSDPGRGPAKKGTKWLLEIFLGPNQQVISKKSSTQCRSTVRGLWRLLHGWVSEGKGGGGKTNGRT